MRPFPFFALICGLALLPLGEGIAAAPDLIDVEVAGSLPGVKDSELTAYLASLMNAAGAGGHQFKPGPDGIKSGDRVDWTFKWAPMASGAVRSYGFSSAQLRHLMGSSRRVVTIEARLFSHNQYQALVSGEASSGPDRPDPELVDKLSQLTHQLMILPELSAP